MPFTLWLSIKGKYPPAAARTARKLTSSVPSQLMVSRPSKDTTADPARRYRYHTGQIAWPRQNHIRTFRANRAQWWDFGMTRSKTIQCTAKPSFDVGIMAAMDANSHPRATSSDTERRDRAGLPSVLALYAVLFSHAPQREIHIWPGRVVAESVGIPMADHVPASLLSLAIPTWSIFFKIRSGERRVSMIAVLKGCL